MSAPSSPIIIDKLWKPELYKIQLEAPTPKPLHCATYLLNNDNIDSDGNDNICKPAFYGSEYHGRISHTAAEKLLDNTPDGTYLIRRSPSAHDYFTLSLRFNNRTKHYKVYFKEDAGHYLHEQAKHFETIEDLVADGLVNFYMHLHAAPIIQEMNQQTESCYQQSPYMTLNRRKLRSLSENIRRSITTSFNRSPSTINLLAAAQDNHYYNIDANANDSNDASQRSAIKKEIEEQERITKEYITHNRNNEIRMLPNTNVIVDNDGDNGDDVDDDDIIWPFIYEKSHAFKIHTFKGLNWCEVCANFLWGFTAQGVKCDDCGIIAHNKCSEFVPAKCIPDLKRIRGVFGIDLTTVVQLHKTSIPFVVQRCVEEVELRGMFQEGIYRVSGFADEIDALKMALDRDGEKTDMSEAAYGNINVIAGTLKLFLRLLPVPIITYQAYPKFMEASRLENIDNQIKQMSLAVKNLPLAHYNCLKYMMKHLKKVASHYELNKMNEHNLATVFAPTLIATPQHLINLTEEIFMLSFLIAHSTKIFN